MRAVAGCNWGADKQALIDIYRSMMRSTIHYGCIVHGAAAKTSLLQSDRLQYKALRLCIGAVKSSPINAVLIEAGETPLEIRREKLALSHWVRLQGSGEVNITNRILQDCWEYAKFQGRGFGRTSKERTRACGVETITFAKATPFSVPPWLSPEAKINMSIVERNKEWQINEVGIKTSI